jgi:trk system potassium uptake protein TrkH
MAYLGLDMSSAVSSVAATLGNIGPGLGAVGPAYDYALIPQSGKVLLTFMMLLGRLEIVTVMAVLTPAFWRR